MSTCPKGLTVTETINGSPVQPSGVVGVTEYVRTAGELVEFNNSDSVIVVSSVPELPPVITPEGELVGASHEYVVPDGIVPSVGVIDIPEPVHTSCSMLSIDGSGFTVIVNVCGVPSQSLVEGVTENST